MKINRRTLISATLGGGWASFPGYSAGGGAAEREPAARAPRKVQERFARLDEILKQPVLKKHLFPSPIVIETLELPESLTS